MDKEVSLDAAALTSQHAQPSIGPHRKLSELRVSRGTRTHPFRIPKFGSTLIFSTASSLEQFPCLSGCQHTSWKTTGLYRVPGDTTWHHTPGLAADEDRGGGRPNGHIVRGRELAARRRGRGSGGEARRVGGRVENCGPGDKAVIRTWACGTYIGLIRKKREAAAEK